MQKTPANRCLPAPFDSVLKTMTIKIVDIGPPININSKLDVFIKAYRKSTSPLRGDDARFQMHGATCLRNASLDGKPVHFFEFEMPFLIISKDVVSESTMMYLGALRRHSVTEMDFVIYSRRLPERRGDDFTYNFSPELLNFPAADPFDKCGAINRNMFVFLMIDDEKKVRMSHVMHLIPWQSKYITKEQREAIIISENQAPIEEEVDVDSFFNEEWLKS